ncbi:MAG: LytTR family DNA-binding domain-containing protein [Tannerellaceae bacterium]|nr:LytTR family DNA-binding domain-containing protein [Tannerellaceae bacterium]
MDENLNKQTDKTILRCVVVDDEPVAREGLSDFVGKVDFLELVGTCASALEATEFVNKGMVDLIFLDINMPYLSGMDFLESLENPPLTIFTTAYPEYALDGYRLQVVNYLMKPIPFKRFFQAATNALQTFILRNPAENSSGQQDYMYIRQGDSFKKIHWQDILYIESMQNYAKLHFKDDKKVIHQTLSSLEESLPPDQFFRIHKSFLINISRIDSIMGGRVFIEGNELPLSRHRKDELLNQVVYKNLISK